MKRVLVSIFLLLVSLPLLAANVAPTGTVTSPAANALLMLGQPMTIAVDAADSDGTVANVEFWLLKPDSNNVLLGTVSVPPYTFTTTLAPASYTESTNYKVWASVVDNLGAAAATPMVTVTLDKPPVVNMTAPTMTFYAAPVNLTLSSSINARGIAIAKVDYYDGQALVGTSTASLFSITLNNVPSGQHLYTAKAITLTGSHIDALTGSGRASTHAVL
jgi:hypothetical protein